MEVNKEEALRCLGIAQRHRAGGNPTAALRFARKSVALYATPEGKAMVSIVERDVAAAEAGTGAGTGAGNGSASPGTKASPSPSPSPAPAEAGSSRGAPTASRARASGVEEHVSSAHKRHPKKDPASGAPDKKREYTSKQIEVVARIRKCREYEYYEILAVERTCTENEVKKAYKKLALALHPDKNGAPGADEAFKMVSKAFQILSDKGLRSAFDANPRMDPTQRGGGGGGGGAGMRAYGGGMNQGFGSGYQAEMNPEDLFNMFFGGGGMNGFGQSPFGGARVYTFGGGPQFNAHARRARQQAAGGDEQQSPFLALLPIALLVFFVLFSLLPSIFSGPYTPDPGYSFKPSTHYDGARTTWQRSVPYHVNKKEWDSSNIWQSVPETHRDRVDAAMFSSKLRSFERGVEETHIRGLQQQCHNFNTIKQRKIAEEAGVFGWGADYDKIRKLRAEKSPACEQLRAWGVTQQAF